VAKNMTISKQNLIKLGLGGTVSINSETQFTDQYISKHKILKKCKLDLINKGTLKNPELDLIVKEQIDSQSNYSIYKYYSIPIDPIEKYSSESETNIPLFGELSYYSYDKKFKHVNENNFFKKFLNRNKIIGTNVTGSFSRFSFDPNFSNYSTLSGLSYKLKSGTYSNSTGIELSFTTQTLIKDYSKVKLWTESDTSGIVNGNFKDYYIPYPNTIDLTNYNAYSIPVKISTFLNDLNPNGQELNGILMISTGNGTYSKICYISPHSLKSGYQNTYTYSLGSSKNEFNGSFSLQRNSSGILLKSLTLGSEYYTGTIFPKTGVRFATEERSGDWGKSSVTGITGRINDYDIDPNQYIKQDISIKDTLFYKFYSGLYTGNKTFNTGTWDGIIPSGTQMAIEFISTELNKEIGMGPNIYFIYSGLGTNDSIDAKCYNYLSHFNEDNGFIKNTKIKIDGTSLKIRGYGFGNTADEAFVESRYNAKYNFFSKISTIMKTWTPEFIYQNRKYKKLIKFFNKRR